MGQCWLPVLCGQPPSLPASLPLVTHPMHMSPHPTCAHYLAEDDNNHNTWRCPECNSNSSSGYSRPSGKWEDAVGNHLTTCIKVLATRYKKVDWEMSPLQRVVNVFLKTCQRVLDAFPVLLPVVLYDLWTFYSCCINRQLHHFYPISISWDECTNVTQNIRRQSFEHT